MEEKHTDYIYTSTGFAIVPLKTIDIGWVWFKTVHLIIDERPLQYLGLTEKTHYYVNKENRDADYEVYTNKKN